MKLALIGFGNMGKEIATLVEEGKTHTITSISYKKESDTLDIDGIKKADVAIDFTAPAVVLANIEAVANLDVHMVVGTTGWYDRLSEVEKIVKDKGIGFVYGQNFSVGANLFFEIVRHAAVLMNNFEQYDVYGVEAHHTGKKDSPSGTAKKLAEILMSNIKRKKVLQTEKLDRQIKSEELHFASIRGGSNPGYHEVVFDSVADEIKLSHQARGRRGFALGAIMAAEFIKGKKGLYSFGDIFKSYG